MALKYMAIKEYVAKKGMYCPYCESADLTVSNMQVDGPDAWQDVECDDCGKSWTDDYVLTWITEDISEV